MIGRLGKLSGLFLLGVLILAATAWGTLAIAYSDLPGTVLRLGGAGAFGLAGFASAAGLGSRRWRRRSMIAFPLLFAALLVWWSGIDASNDRDWQPEVAVLPYAEIDGDLVTVRNIRNFDYRTETDFTPGYYDKTFDLNELQSVDLIASYWMGPEIAHVFLSFGFAGGDYLAASIETRKEVGEGYSTLKGFFKQYELFYVVADERDVIRVRTNFRTDPPEDVYLYRVHGPIENGRRLFMAYMHRINALKAEPEFYNTLTTNCTTTIWINAGVNPGRVPFSWKLLLSGYAPEFLHDAGRLASDQSFEELRRESLINARARRADRAEDFSARIRGLERTD